MVKTLNTVTFDKNSEFEGKSQYSERHITMLVMQPKNQLKAIYIRLAHQTHPDDDVIESFAGFFHYINYERS